MPDIADPEVRVRVVHNAAGNSDPEQMRKFGVAPVTEPLRKRCAKAVREMNINWDGTVPLCCDDWKGEYVLGKLPEQTVTGAVPAFLQTTFNAMSEPGKAAAYVNWASATSYGRNDPLILTLAQVAGWTSAQCERAFFRPARCSTDAETALSA